MATESNASRPVAEPDRYNEGPPPPPAEAREDTQPKPDGWLAEQLKRAQIEVANMLTRNEVAALRAQVQALDERCARLDKTAADALMQVQALTEERDRLKVIVYSVNTPERVKEATRVGFDRAIALAEQELPTSWLDPLLSGPAAVYRGGNENNVEGLLRAIRHRVLAALRAAREGEK